MILIDFSQFARACLYASQLESDADVNLMKHIIMASIKNVNVKYREQYGRLIVCCDGRNYWRREVFPYYKGKRKEARQNASDYEKKIEEIFFRAKNELINELGENTPWFVVQVPTLEADDLIALLSQEPGYHLIVASDHDFKQLQSNPKVSQICPRTWKEIKTDDPKRYLFEHIMKGDPGDGIPNILSDDDVFMDSSKRQKPMRKTMIEEAWQHLQYSEEQLAEYLDKYECARHNFFKRNKVLVNLLHLTRGDQEIMKWADECRLEIKRQIQEQKDAYTGASKLMKYLAHNEMNKLLDEINDFSTKTPEALI